MKRLQTDILILGAGGAGLFAALHAQQTAPELRVTVAVKGTLAPDAAVCVAGVAVTPNSGVGSTTRVPEAPCDVGPLVPVTVTSYDPDAAPDATVRDNAAVPDPPVTVAGLNDAVAIDGSRPDSDSATSPPKPPEPVTVTSYDAVAPASTCAVAGAITTTSAA